MKRILITLCLSGWLSGFTTMAHPSWGIVVDKQGNIYFADASTNHGSVWKLSKECKLTLLLDHFHAHNVCLDQEGNVITAHGEGNHTMIRINTDHTFDTLFHTEDLKLFFGGNCTWSNKGEIIYGLRDHKYLRSIDQKGNQKNIGDYQFHWNQTVYCAPDGTIYAPDIGVDNGVIVKIDTLGRSEIIASDLISRLERPKDKHNDILLGITQDDNGYIYIAENAGRRIIKVLGNNKTETFYTSDDGWFPSGIDFFARDAYILEFKYSKNGMIGPRITKVGQSGKQSELFNYTTYQKGTTSPFNDRQEGNKGYWWLYLLLIGLGLSAIIKAFQKWKFPGAFAIK